MNAGDLARGAALATIALAGLTHADMARAQVPGSVQDYRLPPAPPSPRPTAAGPVDSDHPVAAPTRPAATPEPQPSPSASPVISLPAPAPRSAAPQIEPPPPRPAPRTSAAEAEPAPPVPSPAQTVAPMPADAPPVADIPPANLPAPPVSVDAPANPSAAADDPPWAWIAGGLAAVLLLFGAVLLRRRRPSDETAHGASPDMASPPESRPEPSPPATLRPAAPPTPAPRPSPAPAAAPEAVPKPNPMPPAETAQPVASDPRPLELAFEARHLSRAMVNASLAYRLTLTNRAAEALGPLRIAGDIISAHGSLSSRDQLTPPSEALAAIHQVPALEPGETLTLSGELRLPLASILPMHSGGARVFVPLARFRIEGNPGTTETHVFVVGQASDRPGGALRPFPLDRGPGVDRGLGQRELGLPA